MRHPLVLLCLLACALVAHAQDDAPKSAEVKGVFDRFTTDELGNLYTLKGDEIALWDPQGERLTRNSIKTFGPVSTIDATFSLKPMIFSVPQGQIAVLDNTLSVQGEVIGLSRIGQYRVAAACMSVQNSFWLFDERDLQLIRVDAQMRPLSNTGRLDQLLGLTPHPAGMQELDGWLYVNDPEHGVHVFDLFGAFVRTLPIIGARSMEVRAGGVFHIKDGVLLRYDLRSFDTMPIVWPTALKGRDVLDARVEGGRAYCLTAEGVVIDQLK